MLYYIKLIYIPSFVINIEDTRRGGRNREKGSWEREEETLLIQTSETKSPFSIMGDPNRAVIYNKRLYWIEARLIDGPINIINQTIGQKAWARRR